MPFNLSIVGERSPPQLLSVTWKDAVLYALGIGAKRAELDYLYEGEGPKVFPSFAVVPTLSVMFRMLARTGGNLATVVHGAQKIVVHKPFVVPATLHTVGIVKGLYDMRRFVQVIVETETANDDGQLVANTTWSLLFRGEGGFGGEAPPKEEPPVVVPKGRPPDFEVEEATTPEQALLYRLSGDVNPLHASPSFAAQVGFPQGPILHGLCTYGHMVRHVAKGACDGDAQRIHTIDGQFRKPVWPGETLVTQGWVGEPGKVALQVRAKERDEIVIGHACALIAAG